MNRRESLKALGLIAAGTGLLAGSCKTDNSKTAVADAADRIPGDRKSVV